MRRCSLIAVAGILMGVLRPACFAQSVPKQAEGSAQAKRSLRGFLETFDRGLNDRFAAAFADLNGDGAPEAIVYLTSNESCGTGGCTMLILAPDGDSWRLLTEVSITWPPIRLLETKSNGWRSIGVRARGGGILPGYDAELRFDGKTYPSNPTMPPARPLTGQPKGETLIAPSAR